MELPEIQPYHFYKQPILSIKLNCTHEARSFAHYISNRLKDLKRDLATELQFEHVVSRLWPFRDPKSKRPITATRLILYLDLYGANTCFYLFINEHEMKSMHWGFSSWHGTWHSEFITEGLGAYTRKLEPAAKLYGIIRDTSVKADGQAS